MAGTGTHLHRILHNNFGAEVTPDCKCGLWIAKMDREPPQWSRVHIGAIIEKIGEEASNRGWRIAVAMPGSWAVRWGIIQLAISRAEKDLRDGKD